MHNSESECFYEGTSSVAIVRVLVSGYMFAL